MYIGRARGFGQKFEPPQPSPYLEHLLPYCNGIQRSPVTLSLIREDIKDNLKSQNNVKPTNDYYLDEAIRRTREAFLLPEKQPLIHLNDVFDQDLPIWSSSPGLPWTQYGYKTKGDIKRDPSAIQRIRWFWHRVKCGKKVGLPDCCAYVRSHLVKPGETKVRAVWGYPATVTFGEAVFAIPLIRAYQKHRTPIAYGYELGIGGMKKLYQQFGKHKYFLGIDFKKFDKTLPPWLIHIAFDVLAQNLDFGKYQDRGTPRVGCVLRMFNAIRKYAICTTIRMCNGERYRKKAGLASGSYFTQLVGSVCNHILLTYAALRNNIKIEDILVFGDDSLVAVARPLTPDDVADALERFGMVVNVGKSGFSKNISSLTFLGYSINAGIPKKSTDKSAASLVWPERNDYTWDSLASRALGILYANLGVDNLIDHWCRTIVQFKPFDLVLTRDQQRYLAMLRLEPGGTLPTAFDFAFRLHGIG
uniref:RdRp n=1 Tax=Hubei partiti-like virus 36 TaxID=1923043 RepID=A0A1L3KLQ4_9VIRU|nr:RdRp [Hubei partiti-like virus 36]